MPPETAPSHRLTVAGSLERATRRLAAAGLSTPRQDAVRLLADLLDTSAPSLLLDPERIIEPDRRRWIDQAVERRCRGEPLAYVTGVAGFRRLTLRVDRRVLIPRPETEGLVDRVLARRPRGTVVDVGTGSGCIALALADEGGYDRVIGLDCSRGAIAVANLNARRTGLDVSFVRADLVAALAPDSVDAMVSNPPYVSVPEYRDLDRGVREFEPRLALESGPDGLDATRDLLAQGLKVVRVGGLVALEIAAARAAESLAIAQAGGWVDATVEADLFGRPRFLLATRGSGQ